MSVSVSVSVSVFRVCVCVCVWSVGQGRDKAGRSAMWIQGSEKGVEPKDEGLVVQAGTLYYLAVHSDLVSLREGT